MMVAAAVQAGALGHATRGVIKLDSSFCHWIDPLYRLMLGERAEWLLPVPDSAW
jgi:hypothetical protein